MVPFTAVSPSPCSRKRRTEFHSAAQRSHFHVALFTCAPRGGLERGIKHGIRKARYIAEHDEPAEMELEGEIREFVSRDVVSNVGRRPENESELVASNISSIRATSVSLFRCYHRSTSVQSTVSTTALTVASSTRSASASSAATVLR